MGIREALNLNSELTVSEQIHFHFFVLLLLLVVTSGGRSERQMESTAAVTTHGRVLSVSWQRKLNPRPLLLC